MLHRPTNFIGRDITMHAKGARSVRIRTQSQMGDLDSFKRLFTHQYCQSGPIDESFGRCGAQGEKLLG